MEAPTDRALPSGPRPAPPGGEHADAAAAEGLGLPLGLPRGGGLPPMNPVVRGRRGVGLQRGGHRLLRQKGQPPPPPPCRHRVVSVAFLVCYFFLSVKLL